MRWLAQTRRASFGPVLLALALALPLSRPSGRDARSLPSEAIHIHVLAGQTPPLVTRAQATFRGRHNVAAPLTLNIGLGAHNAAQLDAFIAAASTPGNPQYGHYLTNAEYMARFAPTPQEVRAVRDWATGAGLAVQRVSPDNLLVTVRGGIGTIERALGVAINDYSVPGRAFMSNDRDPVVPAALNIRAITGLSTFYRLRPMPSPGIHRSHTTVRLRAQVLSPSHDPSTDGYYPDDFRAAYNATPVGDGSGQTIGVILWGAPVPQSDLSAFATNTGTPALVSGQEGANGIDWVSANAGNNDGRDDTSGFLETAMDAEYAHGLAPNSHLRFWLGDCTPQQDDQGNASCDPDLIGLEDAVNAAANDPSVHVVSDSWGGVEAPSLTNPFVASLEASFQHAAAVGTTFYFGSGDLGPASGSSCGLDAVLSDSCPLGPLPTYPADSPYVVSVGGTSLQTDSTSGYNSESAWNDLDIASGGGCSLVFDRPSWQIGLGSSATCAGRAVPDVAAGAGSSPGAYVYEGGARHSGYATSLATPLWAGMAAVANHYLQANGQPPMGFSAPQIYRLATNPSTYMRDFHDVTTGDNTLFFGLCKDCTGYPTAAGWDEVTGWGSPNLANLVGDWGGVPATGTATITTSSTSTPIPSATGTGTPSDAPTSRPIDTPTSAMPAPIPTTALLPTQAPAPAQSPVGASTPADISTETTAGIHAPRSSTPPQATHAIMTGTPTSAVATPVAYKIPLTIRLSTRRLTNGDTLTVGGLTLRGAAVSSQLQVTETRRVMVVTRERKQQRLVTRIFVLYRMAGHAMANAHGQFAIRLHVAYQPATPVYATLTTTVHAARDAATRRVGVLIQPRRRCIAAPSSKRQRCRTPSPVPRRGVRVRRRLIDDAPGGLPLPFEGAPLLSVDGWRVLNGHGHDPI